MLLQCGSCVKKKVRIFGVEYSILIFQFRFVDIDIAVANVPELIIINLVVSIKILGCLSELWWANNRPNG